ncbi:MAG: hypothetical protein AAFQ05_08065 [Pseudomonadota bacterium]
MYDQDSFFDLTPLGQLGLACLSVLLFVAMVYATWRLLRARTGLLKPLGALILFYGFVWVSPQIYFQYFHLLFEFLPDQWVIFPPPDPVDALALLTFSGPHSLSAHGQGVMGWMMIAAPWIGTPRKAQSPAGRMASTARGSLPNA